MEYTCPQNYDTLTNVVMKYAHERSNERRIEREEGRGYSYFIMARVTSSD